MFLPRSYFFFFFAAFFFGAFFAAMLVVTSILFLFVTIAHLLTGKPFVRNIFKTVHIKLQNKNRTLNEIIRRTDEVSRVVRRVLDLLRGTRKREVRQLSPTEIQKLRSRAVRRGGSCS